MFKRSNSGGFFFGEEKQILKRMYFFDILFMNMKIVTNNEG